MKKTLFLLLSVLLALSLVLVTVSCESQANDSKAEEKSNEEKGADFTEDVVKALEAKNQVVFANFERVAKSISNAFERGKYKEAKINATLGFKTDGGVAITTVEDLKKVDASSTATNKYKSLAVVASMKPASGEGDEGSKSANLTYTLGDGKTGTCNFESDALTKEASSVLKAVTTQVDDTRTVDFTTLIKRVLKIAKDGIDFDGTATLDLSDTSDIAITYDVTLTGSADGKTLVVDVTKLEGKMGAKTLFSVKGKITLTLSESFGLTYACVADKSGTGKDKKTLTFSTDSVITAVVEDFEAAFDKCVFSGSAKGSVAFGKNDSKTITVEKLALTETIDGSKYAELDAAYKQTISGDEVDLDDFINGLTINKLAVDGTTYSPKTIKAYIKAAIEAYIASQSEKQ